MPSVHQKGFDKSAVSKPKNEDVACLLRESWKVKVTAVAVTLLAIAAVEYRLDNYLSTFLVVLSFACQVIGLTLEQQAKKGQYKLPDFM